MDRPNVLFVFTDQQFAGAMGVADDHLNTPNMDRLAAEGMRFEDAYCPHPLCTPSRAGLLTGRHPRTVGVTGNNDPIDESVGEETLGHVLDAAGYDTGWGGKWHCPGWGAPEDEITAEGFEKYADWDDNELADDCADFLARERDGPFLAVASIDNPHDICRFPLDRSYLWGDVDHPPAEECPPLPRNFAVPPYEPRSIRRHMEQTTTDVGAMVGADPDEWRQYREVYYRLVGMADDVLGGILDGLEAAGVADETVVIFASDHGDMHGAHRMNQKMWLYEEATRVPLIVRDPGGPGGVVENHLVSLLDVFPTICDYAGVDPPAAVDGRSLRSLIDGSGVGGEFRDHLVVETGDQYAIRGRMVRSEEYKYAVYEHGRPREQLFGMTGDREELIDLSESASHAAVLDEHRRILADHCRSTGDGFDNPKPESRLPGTDP